MLKFRLIEKCWQDAFYYKEADVDFLLEENDLNTSDKHKLEKLRGITGGKFFLWGGGFC